ncbi:MAG: hypothetical protein E6X17_07830, partial [Sporomusaceae bacterium]|nr:hypothetical protein [Sporomusaceae bacterium]
YIFEIALVDSFFGAVRGSFADLVLLFVPSFDGLALLAFFLTCIVQFSRSFATRSAMLFRRFGCSLAYRLR